MNKLLFKSEKRDEAHAFLDKHLKKNPASPAECREDPSDPDGKPYQVFGGPVERE
jgi:hypothetical protein